MLLTHRKLLQSKAIAIENDLRGALRNFGLKVGMTCYNRFVRWRRAGVWDRIMNSLSLAHDAGVQMIDTSIVRVHQHGACITRNRRQSMVGQEVG
jgi:transposase